MNISNTLKILVFVLSLPILLTSCKSSDGKFKLPGGDARKFPADPKKRVEQNLKEGRGFRLNDMVKQRGGTFDFASSNELWRASLDVIDFMPLASANYSGGVIITDWYSDNKNPNESLKITIRFLTNEIRSDALNIKIFYKKCENLNKCTISEKSGTLTKELKKEILKLATQYKKKSDDENFEPYIVSDPKD